MIESSLNVLNVLIVGLRYRRPRVWTGGKATTKDYSPKEIVTKGSLNNPSSPQTLRKITLLFFRIMLQIFGSEKGSVWVRNKIGVV